MGDGLPYSLADTVCVLIGVFAATAVSMIICIISATTNDEVDTVIDAIELNDFQTLICVDKDSGISCIRD